MHCSAAGGEEDEEEEMEEAVDNVKVEEDSVLTNHAIIVWSEFQLLACKYFFWPLCLFELKYIIMVKFQNISLL